MRQSRSWRLMAVQITFFTCLTIALFVVRAVDAGNEPFHLATDWSHRHVLFSAPKTLMDRFRFSMDLRYVQQWVRRNSEMREDGRSDRERWRRHHSGEDPIHRDWNVYLGNVGMVGAGQYPAKFSFDTTVANCGTATQPDFVVWNTSLVGSSTAVAATDSGSFSRDPTNPSTITITNGANSLVVASGGANANTGTGTGTYLSGGGTTSDAANLAIAINIPGNGSFVGVGASSSGATVTFTATTAGTVGNSITITASTTPPSRFTPASNSFVNGASGVATSLRTTTFTPPPVLGRFPPRIGATTLGVQSRLRLRIL